MKTLITLFAIAGMVLALAPAAQAASIFNDESGFYSATGTWSGGVVPTSGDTVFIGDFANGSTVTLAAGTHSCGNMRIRKGSTLSITGGSLGAGIIDIGKDAGNLFVVSGGTLTAARVGAASGTSGNTFRIDGSSGTINLTDMFSTSSSDLDLVMDASGISVINLANVNANTAWDLTVDTSSYTGPGGDITLINNTSGGTVQTFASVLVDGLGTGFTIAYDGGDGNDVVLTLPASGPTVELGGGTTGNVDENQPIGTVVGTLSTANLTPPITFSFNGGADDASFSIDGTDLKTAEIFDEDVKSSYSIDVLATDSAGPAITATNTFTITIDPVAEPGGAMFARGEVQTGLTLVGTLETLLDPSDASVTYAVDATTYHGALFEISGGASFTLHLKAPPSAGAVGDEYFVQVTPSGNSSGAYPPMLIKVTVVSGPAGTVIRIR